MGRPAKAEYFGDDIFYGALAQVPDEFVQGLELLGGGLFLVEITNKADAQGDIVQVVAVDMAPVDLFFPAVAHLDLTIARGGAVADDKVVSQPV